MKQNKIKIAVTGGIGSGKSAVCKIIGEMGYPIFSCDKTYAELLNNGNIIPELVREFGDAIIDANGSLNRSKLSEIVFGDSEKLKKLDKITHSKIFEKMFSEAELSEGGVCFFEVPVLFEGGYEKLFDDVIVVMRDREERIGSVVQRDNLSKEEVEARVNNQFKYENNDLTQYYVIHNNGKINDLYAKIINILSNFTI